MGLRLGSQVIPTVRLYKSGAKYPTGVIEINSETPVQCSVEITTSNSTGSGVYSRIIYEGTKYYTTGDKFTVMPGDVINIWVESQRTDAAYVYLNGEQIAGGLIVSGQIEYNYIIPNNMNVFIRINDGPTSYVYITEEELDEKTYDVSDYAFARAEFEDNLEKRINGTLSYYSNSIATSIADYAFTGTDITGVSLPNVTRLGSCAFASCTSLTSIYLPKLSSMSSSVFANCTNLSSFSFPLCSIIASHAFMGCTGLPSNLILPSNFTTIGPGAFGYCSNLQTVQGLGAISVYGFSHCDNLITLSLPVCVTIGGCSYMTKLQTLYAPSLKNIEGWALAYCYALQTLSCPNILSIGGYAMASCSSLLSLSLSLANRIDAYAFPNCRQLRTAYLPLLSVLNAGVFQNCFNLQTVNIPSCTSIGAYAFYYCSSLTTLSVPFCSFIGNYAFYNCSNLSTLYLASNSVVTLSGANAFNNTPTYGSIFVPASLVDAYKSATNWVAYSSRITSI